MNRAAMVMVIVIVMALGGCAEETSREDVGSDESLVGTVDAEGVDLTVHATRLGRSISGTIEVANRSGGDVIVSDPERTEIDDVRTDHLALVAMREEADPDFRDALTSVAPPGYPGVQVARDQVLDLDVRFGGFNQDHHTLELCLEVIEVLGRGHPDRHGEEVTVAGREPGAPAPMVCSGPVEIVDEE